MDEYVKWIVGHFWQRFLASDKQASFIKIDGEPKVRRFLSRNVGIWREWLEATGSLKVNPRQKHLVACTRCKLTRVLSFVPIHSLRSNVVTSL